MNCQPERTELSEGIRIFYLVALSLMLTVNVLGNSLTLVALHTVSLNHRGEFSLLQRPVFLLLLHLSLLDLLYGVVGFPHFIHGLYVMGDNPFDYDGGSTLCWLLAFFRNWFSEMDFANMGAIAFLARRQKLCKQCESKNDYSKHEEHDWLFTKRGILLIILMLWVISLISILPDCFGWTGGYQWTNTAYGCDNVYCGDNKKSYGMIVNILLNTLIIVISYYSIVKRLVVGSLEESIDSTLRPEVSKEIYQQIKMLMRLAVTYTICVIPASFLCWGIFRLDWFEELDNVWSEQLFEATLNCLYWSMYCINFLLYYLPNSGIKRAYDTFFRDVKKCFMKSIKHGTKRRIPHPPVSPVKEWDLAKDNPNSKIKTTRVTVVLPDMERTIVETKM